MLLRTRTAIGDTATIWGDTSTSDCELTFMDLDGTQHTEEFECEFLLPTAKLKSTSSISLRDFQDWLQGDRSDAQKRKMIRDKILYHSGSFNRSGRNIRFWACFVQNRKAWDIVSVNAGLVGKEILELSPVERIDQYGDAEYLFGGGMYTSTRSMPTGIRSEMKTRGSSGYLPNFFIIVDDPQLSFDIGRKSIPGRQLGMLRELAGEIFRTVLNAIKKYMGGEPELEEDPWEKARVFSEIRGLPELVSERTLFSRRPYSQEASVAAIFYELLGNKTLEGFQPYISGYKNRYDLYATYDNSDVVVEFKHNLAGLFRDFDDEVKLFDQIDIVVVWDVTEADREIISSRGLSLEAIHTNELAAKQTGPFHFNIILGPTSPIKVLCIRRFIEDLSS